jgi:hypothetical protein
LATPLNGVDLMAIGPVSLLAISPIGVPPYSARGASQTLDPLNGVFARTVDGELIDLTPPQFKLWKTSISCTDLQSPAINEIARGMVVVIDCVAEIKWKTDGGSPDRPIVEGSERIDEEWTYGRPRLTMMITNHSVQKNEFQAAVSWHIEAEEKGPL